MLYTRGILSQESSEILKGTPVFRRAHIYLWRPSSLFLQNDVGKIWLESLIDRSPCQMAEMPLSFQKERKPSLKEGTLWLQGKIILNYQVQGMYGHPHVYIIRKQISDLNTQIHGPSLIVKCKWHWVTGLRVGRELDPVNQKPASN